MSAVATNKQVYIKTLIETLESDKKMVMLYITLALAIPVLTTKEVVFGESQVLTHIKQDAWMLYTLSLSALACCFSAFLTFLYFHRLHINIFAVTPCILNDDADTARLTIFGGTHPTINEKFEGLWPKHGWKYTAGQSLLYVGVVLYVLVLAEFVLP